MPTRTMNPAAAAAAADSAADPPSQVEGNAPMVEYEEEDPDEVVEEEEVEEIQVEEEEEEGEQDELVEVEEDEGGAEEEEAEVGEDDDEGEEGDEEPAEGEEDEAEELGEEPLEGGEEEVDEFGEEPAEEVGEDGEDGGGVDEVDEEPVEFEKGKEGDRGNEEEEKVEEAREVPEPVKQKRKRREFEVFVGGLPHDATEEDVKKVFREAGEVAEVRLVKKPRTNKNKGFAFVRFATVEQAKRAATDLKHVQVKGKTCGVIRSNDNETLHLGHICTSWTKDDLIEKLKAYDLENLEEVHLIEDPKIKGKNRGYAFLDFSTHMDAVAACTKLQKREIYFGVDVRAEVSFSITVEPDEEVMAQVKSIFVDGLPATWDEPKVREHFKKFGKIESVELARNMPSAKRKDFGFISFDTRQAALDCIEKVNKDGVGEGAEKVLVKASLKRPLQKQTPPMLGVRRGYIGKSFGMRRPDPYASARPFPRPVGSRGLVGKGIGDRPRGLGRFSSRGIGKRAVISPQRKLGPPRPRGGFARDMPAPRARPRGGFARDIPGPGSIRRRSRSRQSVGSYVDATYSHHRRPYADDVYDSRFERHEPYEYPVAYGYKRSYSELDHAVPPPSSLTRRARSRPLERDAYPQIRGSTYDYDEHSRFPPDAHFDYDRTRFAADRDYEIRYLSRSGASRTYY